MALLCLAVQTLLSGCHSHKTPTATDQDLEAAQREAQREVAEARAEASKDIKSATKIAGPASKDVTYARATGAFDVAMARAEGNHKVATEKCLTLEAALQTACKDQADKDYETAKAAAKAARTARQQ
jgi:uncharacterized protein YceK